MLGAIVSVAGAVGWFRDVLPQEAHESVTVSRQLRALQRSGAK